MNEVEVRAWKEWLLQEGQNPQPFAWATWSDPVRESTFRYEPSLNAVIEHRADGKRYVVDVCNGEFRRTQELEDEAIPSQLPGRGELRSR